LRAAKITRRSREREAKNAANPRDSASRGLRFLFSE